MGFLMIDEMRITRLTASGASRQIPKPLRRALSLRRFWPLLIAL